MSSNVKILDPERVDKIFDDCVYKGERNSERIRVEGITTTVGFHSGRLEMHRTEI